MTTTQNRLRDLTGEKDPFGLRETWRDRLSADVVRNPLIADLVGQCEWCKATFAVPIGGTERTWVIKSSSVDRGPDGWRHTKCTGHLRLLGTLPAYRPRRIVLERERWTERPR